MNNTNIGIQKAGSVEIVDLKLISSTGFVIDLQDFLIEFNIYEDIFASVLYGDISLSDSRNIIQSAPIIGEEYLNICFRTPSFQGSGDFIKKSFRVFRLSNRLIVRDNSTQTFKLHFASTELFYDVLLPVYRIFEGNVAEVALDVFNEYLKTPRDFEVDEKNKVKIDIEKSSSFFVSETDNKIKFVSPGWTPLKIISWLASKSIPKDDTKSKDFLFFETTKSFYFTSIEKIFKDVQETGNIVDEYTYAVSNIKEDKKPDIRRELALVNKVEMVESTDYMKNYTNGYLASRLITLDVFNKKYEAINYDYVEDYKNYYHSSGKGTESAPLFEAEGPRTAFSSISFYPVNPRLFQESTSKYFEGNTSERMKEIYGNRKSSLLGLTNVKLNLTVPGRTDIEVGRMIDFNYPQLGPTDETDKTNKKKDTLFSGRYLITAVNHRVTPSEHTIIMEVVKDSSSTLNKW